MYMLYIFMYIKAIQRLRQYFIVEVRFGFRLGGLLGIMSMDVLTKTVEGCVCVCVCRMSMEAAG